MPTSSNSFEARKMENKSGNIKPSLRHDITDIRFCCITKRHQGWIMALQGPRPKYLRGPITHTARNPRIHYIWVRMATSPPVLQGLERRQPSHCGITSAASSPPLLFFLTLRHYISVLMPVKVGHWLA